MMFEASRRKGYLTTSTSGLSALIDCLGGVDLGHADAVGRVDDLALEVRDVDDVVVDDPERADAGGGEVERGRRAEAAGAEQQHLGVEQLLLALGADLGQEEVARVALALLGRERPGDDDVVAAVLPQRDAAGHRLDVLEAEVAPERVGAERGALAGRAVEDHALRAVGRDAVDARLEVAARDVHGARQVPGVPLLLLAHVDDHDALVEELAHLGGIDLVDLRADLLDVLGSGGAHRFTKDSDRRTVVDPGAGALSSRPDPADGGPGTHAALRSPAARPGLAHPAGPGPQRRAHQRDAPGRDRRRAPRPPLRRRARAPPRALRRPARHDPRQRHGPAPALRAARARHRRDGGRRASGPAGTGRACRPPARPRWPA